MMLQPPTGERNITYLIGPWECCFHSLDLGAHDARASVHRLSVSNPSVDRLRPSCDTQDSKPATAPNASSMADATLAGS